MIRESFIRRAPKVSKRDAILRKEAPLIAKTSPTGKGAWAPVSNTLHCLTKGEYPQSVRGINL